MCLGQNHRCRLIVNGHEHQISAGILRSGQLHGEVGIGIIGKGALVDNVQTLSCSLRNEGIPDALRICVIVAVNHGNLLAGHVGSDVGCGAGALVGVGKADLEHIVLAVNDVGGRCRGRQAEHTVIVGFCGNSQSRTGGGGSDQNLHTVVQQLVICVNGGLAVGYVILEHQFNLSAALGVNLVNSNLSAVLHGVAVNCSLAGQGSQTAEFVSTCGFGLVRVGTVCRIFRLATAGSQSEHHAHGQNCAHEFFHFRIPPHTL